MSVIIWNLILWRDIRKSALAFGGCLFLLTALSIYSFLTVSTCITIPLLTTTLVLRGIWAVKCTILKSQMEHPFQGWLEDKWTLEDNKIASYNKRISLFVNDTLVKIKQIILVADIVDSLKALFILFILNYIGKSISGITLLFICIMIAFTIPKLYDVYHVEINKIINNMKSKYNETYSRIRETIPIGKVNNNAKIEKNKES